MSQVISRGYQQHVSPQWKLKLNWNSTRKWREREGKNICENRTKLWVVLHCSAIKVSFYTAIDIEFSINFTANFSSLSQLFSRSLVRKCWKEKNLYTSLPSVQQHKWIFGSVQPERRKKCIDERCTSGILTLIRLNVAHQRVDWYDTCVTCCRRVNVLFK